MCDDESVTPPRDVEIANPDESGTSFYPVRYEQFMNGWVVLHQEPSVETPRTSKDQIALSPAGAAALQVLLNERSPPVALDRDAIRAEAVAEFATKLAAHLKAEDKKLDNELARWDATIKVHTDKVESLRRVRGQDFDRQYEVRRLLCKIEDMKESMGDA